MKTNFLKIVSLSTLCALSFALSSCSSSLDANTAFEAVKASYSADDLSFNDHIMVGKIVYNTPDRAAFYKRCFSEEQGANGALSMSQFAHYSMYQDKGLLSMKDLPAGSVSDYFKNTRVLEITLDDKCKESVIGVGLLGTGHPDNKLYVKYYTFNLTKPIEIKDMGEYADNVNQYILTYEIAIDGISPFAEADGIKIGDPHPISKDKMINYALLNYDSKSKDIRVDKKGVVKESEINTIYEKYLNK